MKTTAAEGLFGLLVLLPLVLGLCGLIIHNLTARGPNGAWPFGGDW